MNALVSKFKALTEREQILVMISAVVVVIGLFYFLINVFKKDKKYLKYIFLISLFTISALIISKTNDDLSYYHLPFTKYITEHKIIFGMGHLNHGYNLLSSIFYLNSIF